MKKLFILLSLLAAITFTACEKEIKYSTITFQNYSSNPYMIYVDDEYKFTVDGNWFEVETFEEGSYNCKAVQQSGYVLYPTVKNAVITISEDQPETFYFP